jgi:hypothetical protein
VRRGAGEVCSNPRRSLKCCGRPRVVAGLGGPGAAGVGVSGQEGVG